MIRKQTAIAHLFMINATIGTRYGKVDVRLFKNIFTVHLQGSELTAGYLTGCTTG